MGLKRVTAGMVALMLLAVACGAPTDGATPNTEVTFDATAVMDEGNLLIQVGTDLPDGTLLTYEVREGELGLGDGYANGNMTVADGKGSAQINVSDWGDNKIRVFAAFRPWTDGQPQSIVDRFEYNGQNLTGSNISESGDFRSIEFSKVVSKG